MNSLLNQATAILSKVAQALDAFPKAKRGFFVFAVLALSSCGLLQRAQIPTSSSTSTDTSTNSSTGAASGSSSNTSTMTSTATATITNINSGANTVTGTISPTATATSSASQSLTSTSTATNTRTTNSTASNTQSATTNQFAPVAVYGGGYVIGMEVAADGTKVIRTDTYSAYVWNGSTWKYLLSSNTLIIR